MGNDEGHLALPSLTAQRIGESVQSSRALGVFALASVILAAISFAAVDVTVSASPSDPTPVSALLYAGIGVFALIASVIPAFIWFTRSINHPHHDADIEPLPVTVTSRTFDEDEV